MDLDLDSVQYVVFDEVNRLSEVGFLNEISKRLPSPRQTILFFLATLPKSLVKSAKAGFQDARLGC